MADGRKEILINVGIFSNRTDRQNFVVIHTHRNVVFNFAGDLTA